MKKQKVQNTAIVAASDVKKPCALVRLFRQVKFFFYKTFAKSKADQNKFETYTFIAFTR